MKKQPYSETIEIENANVVDKQWCATNKTSHASPRPSKSKHMDKLNRYLNRACSVVVKNAVFGGVKDLSCSGQ